MAADEVTAGKLLDFKHAVNTMATELSVRCSVRIDRGLWVNVGQLGRI